jgi:CopG family nickel-responsive transcriptional regulator
MQRLTISLDDDLARDFDTLFRDQAYQSRSEAVRDLVRSAVEARRLQGDGPGDCVASLSYIYNHHTRALAQRLNEMAHQHHDLVVATTHVHLDHDDCLETVILKGAVPRVREFADLVQAERGVRFADLNLVRVEPNNDHLGGAHDHSEHQHLSPARS